MSLTGATCVSDFSFNEAKFVHLHFWPKATDKPIYVVNSKPIKQSQQHKDLEVTFLLI